MNPCPLNSRRHIRPPKVPDKSALHPNGCLRVDDLKNGRTYIAPDNETEERFLDRLERSKKEGRNLFFIEWHEQKHKKGVWQ